MVYLQVPMLDKFATSTVNNDGGRTLTLNFKASPNFEDREGTRTGTTSTTSR